MENENEEGVIEISNSDGINLSEVKPGSVKKPDETNQTSTEDGAGDGESSTEDTTKADETASGNSDDTGKKTENKDGGEEGDVDYKVKFSESSKEANRLLDVNKTLENTNKEDRATISKLEATKKVLEDSLKENDPEAFEKLQSRIKQETDSRELESMKIDDKLNKFIAENEGSEEHREALKHHLNANPDKSLDAIWKEHGFQAMVESKDSGDGTSEEENKDGNSDDKNSSGDDAGTEDGKGTSTGDHAKGTIGGHSPEAFNKLPLLERKAILSKEGGVL